MPNPIRICGVDYPDCSVVCQGKWCGLMTPKSAFWLWPKCDDRGNEINEGNPIPPFPPREIRRITCRIPDLTQQFPDTVKELFKKRLSYFTRTTTLKEYLKGSPGLVNPPVDEEAFQAGRQRLLTESLDDFARDRFARELVWHEHGTQEIADQHGYLGMVCENGYFSRSRAQILISGIQNAYRWTGQNGYDAAAEIVATLKYEMRYDVKSPRFVYLDEMKEAALPTPPKNSTVVVDAHISVQSQITNEAQLVVPGWEKVNSVVERAEAAAKSLHGAGETVAQKVAETGEAVSKKLNASAAEVRKATESGDLYSNPSMANAKDAAIRAKVPKEFVVYCHAEMHVRKFPSTDQAHKAVSIGQTFRALRDPKTPSRATVGRWLKQVRDELEKRGLLPPRGKGKSAKGAPNYDVHKHPAPKLEDATLEQAEEEQIQGGRTSRDSRQNELPDEPESYDPPDKPGLH